MMGESLPSEQPVDYASEKYALESEIEIMTISDKRLKVLGEELSNENSCAILSCIMQGKKTASEIAIALNLSLPLVVYHIQRLLHSNIIRIDGIELNSKGREKKTYGANKAAIIIQLNTNDVELSRKLKRLFILSASAAAIGIVSAIWQTVSVQGQFEMVITNPDDYLTPLKRFAPIILSTAGGIASGLLAWMLGWLKRNK